VKTLEQKRTECFEIAATFFMTEYSTREIHCGQYGLYYFREASHIDKLIKKREKFNALPLVGFSNVETS